MILGADQDLRAYAAKIPDHLVCRSAPLWRVTADRENDDLTDKLHPKRLLSDYHQSTDLSDEGVPLVLKLQQIRLAMLWNNAISQFFTSKILQRVEARLTTRGFSSNSPIIIRIITRWRAIAQSLRIQCPGGDCGIHHQPDPPTLGLVRI